MCRMMSQKDIEKDSKNSWKDKKNFASRFNAWKNNDKNKSSEKNKTPEKVCSLEASNYVEASDEIFQRVVDNQESLMEIFAENEWDVEKYMEMSDCSNCDERGHILESCPMLFDENKFRQQCLVCHTLDVDVNSCCDLN